MNTKEAIQKVLDFYRSEGKPAFDKENNNCAYYIDDNTRCAVGCLLSIESAKELQHLYPEGMDMLGVYEDLDDSEATFSDSLKNELKTLIEDLDVYFLNGLQGCHDIFAQHPETFLENFEREVKKLEEVE